MRPIYPVAVLLISAFVVQPTFAEKPNFLIILADDCTYSDLPLYGGQNAKTPNIDRLASESLVFNRAYLSEAICMPCRSAMYSGQYPMHNGAAYNHSASREGTQSLPQYLRPLGYRVGLTGKKHVEPRTAYPFTDVPGFDDNCVRNPTKPHSLAGIKQFMTDKTEPFCLVIGLTEPHVPWVMGDPSAYPLKQLKLPPNLADTDFTRRDFASYLAEITYMDGQVGEILATLAEVGQADNTLVLFTSEQGAQFPGCKWTCWDTGLHTAMIARWPGKAPEAKRTDAIIQYVDVVPTLLELAGAEPAQIPTHLDGASFREVLLESKPTHRQLAYGVLNNIPEGPPYPIRTVTDGTYRYIRNFEPGNVYIEKHLMGFNGVAKLRNQYWPTWIFQASNHPKIYALVQRYLHRPAEQLYLTKDDPFELENLADDPQHKSALTRLSAELDGWMKRQNDPGSPADTMPAYQAARKSAPLYGLSATASASPESQKAGQ